MWVILNQLRRPCYSQPCNWIVSCSGTFMPHHLNVSSANRKNRSLYGKSNKRKSHFARAYLYVAYSWPIERTSSYFLLALVIKAIQGCAGQDPPLHRQTAISRILGTTESKCRVIIFRWSPFKLGLSAVMGTEFICVVHPLQKV